MVDPQFLGEGQYIFFISFSNWKDCEKRARIVFYLRVGRSFGSQSLRWLLYYLLSADGRVVLASPSASRPPLSSGARVLWTTSHAPGFSFQARDPHPHTHTQRKCFNPPKPWPFMVVPAAPDKYDMARLLEQRKKREREREKTWRSGSQGPSPQSHNLQTQTGFSCMDLSSLHFLLRT